MGRRALPKLDRSLDVSRHLRTLQELACPLEFAPLFGRSAPVEVEVGSGKGLFLARASADCPEHNFLGIELAYRYARYAAAQLAKRHIANALVVHGDAGLFFAEYLPSESVAAVHVYFPDPWWKKRHWKRRLMQPPFLQCIERVLEPGGMLHFWTDVEQYSESARADVAATTELLGPFDVSELSAEHDRDYRTDFERRMRLGAKPVYRSLYQKRGGSQSA